MLKTEHLPECWAKHQSDPEAWCICDELRACEERVLNAAREAVAPMEAVVLRIAATLVRHPSEDDLHDALRRHWCGELKAALFQYRAAIDALKESND